jgi:DNA polymerase-3 subunit delta
MKPAQWRKHLKQQLPPVCLLAGEDPGLRRRALEHLRSALGGDVDEEHFDGDFDPAELADALQTLPFFSGARLTVLRAGRLTGERAERLLALAARVQAPNYLALLLEKLDKRSRLYKRLAEVTVDCSPLGEAELRRSVQYFLKQRGVRADADAVEYILLAGGNSVESLENRVEALALLINDGETLTAEQVRRALSASPDFDRFGLCDLLTAGRPAAAVAQARIGLVAGEEPLALIGLIARHYRIVQLVGHLLRLGRSDKELSSATGVYYKYLGQYKAAAGRLSAEEVLNARRVLTSFDAALKLGLPDPPTAFLELIYVLARGGEAGWPNYLADLPGALDPEPTAAVPAVLRPRS